ncbi:MAG: DUF4388 domain-containing protein [Candidatus Alcyoniella australis]|nr:DUF4388 domain-containing protein [Candidatus Alcyoniella australis]
MASRILVVENDDGEWEFLSEVFNVRGETAVRAVNGDQALELLKKKPGWGLIIIESLLPKRSGAELCLTIKETAEGRQTPVLLIGSIFKNFKIAQQAKFKFRADDLLIKPFTLDELEQKLSLHLEGMSLEQLQQLDQKRIKGSEIDAAPPAKLDLAGSLENIRVGRLLSWIAEHEETGALRVVAGQSVRCVYFKRGKIVYASSRSCGQSLGQMLLKRGVIDQPTLVQSLQQMIEHDRRQGEALLQMQVLTPHQLYKSLSEHVARIVVDLFSIRVGAYYFELLSGVPGLNLALQIDLSAIVFEGIRRYYSPSGLEEEFSELSKFYIHPVVGGPFQIPNLSLSSQEKRFASSIDGSANASDVFESTDMGDFDVRALTLGMIMLGSVKLDMLPASEHPQQGGIPYGQPDRSKNNDVNAYMDEIETLYNRLRSATEAEALELDQEQDADSALKAYIVAATSLHNRLLFSKASAIARARADASLLILHSAYSSFALPDLDPNAVRPAPEPDTRSVDKADVIRASLEFVNGRAKFDDAQYSAAFELFERSSQLDPLRGEYFAWSGWALFNEALVTADEQKNERARELIDHALMLDPNLSDGHLFKGLTHKHSGDMPSAENSLEFAADLRPNHAQTLIELREIYRRKRLDQQNIKRNVMDSEALKAYISHIESWYQAQAAKNLYELLSLSPEDDPRQARQIYFDLAETIRPPKIYANSPLLIQEMADEIFHRLTEAYETISDPHKHELYQQELERNEQPLDEATLSQCLEQAQTLRKRAQSMLEANDIRGAGQLFKRSHATHGEDLHSLVGYGECLYRDYSGFGISKAQAFQKAKGIMHQALNSDPTLAKAHAVLGRIYLDEHKIELAEEEFDKTLELDPRNLQALHGFRMLHSGQWHERRRQQTKAGNEELQLLRDELEKRYDKLYGVDYVQALDVSIDSEDEDVDGAYRQKIEELSALDNADLMDSDSVTKVLVHQIRRRLSDADWILSTSEGRTAVASTLKSRKERDRIHRVKELNTARECMELGWDALRDKDMQTAQAAYSRATRLAPGSGPAKSLVALCRWRSAAEGEPGLEQRNEALDAAREASKVDPDAWEVWYALGLIQKARGSTKEAIAWLKKAAALAPNVPEVQRDLKLLSSRSNTEKVYLKDLIVDRLKSLFRRNKG